MTSSDDLGAAQGATEPAELTPLEDEIAHLIFGAVIGQVPRSWRLEDDFEPRNIAREVVALVREQVAQQVEHVVKMPQHELMGEHFARLIREGGNA